LRSILVIEDDETTLFLFKHHFKNEINTEFYYASTYLEGLALITNRSFDAYILDLNLNGYPGIDLLKILQKEKNIDNRVIIISADSSDSTKAEAYDLGASNFMLKPINIKVLRAIINKNLRALEYKFDEKIDLGSFWISIEQHLCFLREENIEKEVSLTLTEFKILLRLARSPNIIVSKDELSYLGKDPTTPMSYKSLEMHIASLRKKLRNKELIQSKRSLGYVLIYHRS